MPSARTSVITIILVIIATIPVLQIVLANGPQNQPEDTLAIKGIPGDSLRTSQMIADSSASHTTVIVDTATAGDAALIDQVPDSSEADSVAHGELVSGDSTIPSPAPIPMEEFRVIENNAFGVGERLEFEISYGPIKAGSAVMEVKEIVELEGRDCYRVVSTARSNNFFSAIYRVEDHVESFLDVRGLFSWKFTQKLHEGKHRADRWAVYDQVNHTVTTNRGTMDVPLYVQDVLSTMYYVRTQPMEVGLISYVDNHSDRKVYPLAVKVHRREQVEVPAGTFDCFVVEPMLKAGGLFKHEGRIWVWLTADERKLPVLMKTKVIIGTVDAKLKIYRLGKIL